MHKSTMLFFLSLLGILDERGVYDPPALFICFTARNTSPWGKITMGSLEFIRNTFGKGMDWKWDEYQI